MANICKSYRKEKNRERYLRVRDDMLASKAEQYKNDPDKFLSRAKNQSIEKQKAWRKKWADNNKATLNARNAKRRAIKLSATPSWLTLEDIENIRILYREASNMSNEFQKFHVDHIVPLLGNNVCGLHVPWNLQILPAETNLRKSNKNP